MNRRPILLISALLTTAAAGCGGPSTGSETATARVTRVVDGDTVVVQLDGRSQKVRYIGVDTPESVKPNTPVQCWAKKASELNRKLVAGQTVTLQFDHERTDRYGRLLAYVQRSDGLNVNAELLKAGAARTMEISPNTSRAQNFRALAAQAQRERRGLWGMCGSSQARRGALVLSTG